MPFAVPEVKSKNSFRLSALGKSIGNIFKRGKKIMFEDKTLTCKECGNEFVFTAGEQEFYAEKGFVNEPQRCKACRDARKNAARGEREWFTATCAACGGEAKVPFQPREDRPVYCSECFAKQKEEA
jgi:CxxC-x17-CxxC domain-containing protein